MIFFVWSLVSSAIEAARKRHIANFLRALLQQQRATRNYEMLIWKTFRKSSSPPSTSRSHKLYRPKSEPKLDSTLVLQTDLMQVFSENFETLRASEWRFCPSLWPNEEDSIYFVVYDELAPTLNTSPPIQVQTQNSDSASTSPNETNMEPSTFKLHEKCDRLAIHKTMNRSLYACSFEMFVDVVDAFSEKLLTDEHFQVVQIFSMFAPPQEIEATLRPDMNIGTSTLSLASTSHQRPLPILQHLFWGDSQFLNERFGSEGNLDSDMMRMSMSSPSGGGGGGQTARGHRNSSQTSSSSHSFTNRRRYRSCHSPDGSQSPRLQQLQQNLNSFAGGGGGGADSAEFRSLPRYLRHLNLTPRSSLVTNGQTPSDFSAFSEDFDTIPRYIRQINQAMSSDDVSRQPTASDSYSSSFLEDGTKAMTRTTTIVEDNDDADVAKKKTFSDASNSIKSHFTLNDDEMRMIDETDTDTIDSTRLMQQQNVEKVSYAALAQRVPAENGKSTFMNGSVTIKLEIDDDQNGDDIERKAIERKPTPYPRDEPDPESTDNTDGTVSEMSSERTSNGEISEISNVEEEKRTILKSLNNKPPSGPPPSKKEENETSGISPALQYVRAVGRDKRSTSVAAGGLPKSVPRRFSAFSIDSDRGRSVSPAFEHYQNRSLRGFTSAANPNRNSTRRSNRRNLEFSSIREIFGTSRNKSHKAMAKPDSVLVYVGGDDKVYSDIRHRLDSLLPPDEITVFNVSIEALRKQPWAEKSTVCVIIASTKDLDDQAWEKIQAYFNQNGKLIFVCQNKLLASVTGCDTSKKQASILRFAFGSDNNKLKENNKEFAKFLEKSLKNLPKTGIVNETFRTKDVGVGASFSVVLKKENDSPLFLYMQNSGSSHASALFSDATAQQLIAPNSNLLRDSLKSVGVKVCEHEVAQLTKGVMVAEYDSIIDGIAGLRLGEEIGTRPKVLLRKSEIVAEEGLPEVSNELLPIEVVRRSKLSNEICDFNFDEYFEQLTAKMGQVIVGIDIATTTMDVCESLNNAIPSLSNVVVVANRQMKGKGRGGNEFISPKGSALFNFSFAVSKSSRFAKNIPILQHVFCVALVDATRILSGYPDFPLRIKWPNDLYYERSHKVGGMLITCKSRDDAFLISIGCGVNVSNEKPTICLNDMLPSEAENKFSREKLIAETLNRYQYYINDYEQNGPDLFRKKYYEYWLHSQQEVLLSDFDERVTIRGIDEYGYLQVRSKSNPDKIFSIGDDGNTFDMMKGLIRHKF